MLSLPAPSLPDRRAVLRSAALIGVLSASAAGCGRDSPARPVPIDPLIAQETLARSDAERATASSPILTGQADALRTIAAERTQHANALRAEINRRTGVYEDGTTPSARATTGVPVPTQVPALTLAQLRERLETSRRTAAELARSQQGYRAGLLASISAACAVHGTVLLR